MSASVNAKTYTANSFAATAIGYQGPNHTVSVKDYLRLSSVAPKPTVTFSGVGRQSAKLTRTSTLTGSLTPTWDAIIDVQTVIPVGMASADVDTLLNDVGAYVASAAFKTLCKNQQISY
jgi:hypothetical protein